MRNGQARTAPIPLFNRRGGPWRVLIGLVLMATISTAAFAQTPTAVDDAYAARSGFLLQVEGPGVMENDHDGGGEPPPSGTPVAHLVSGAGSGTLVLYDNGSFDYTSNVGFSGVDTFTYYFVNDTGTSNTATVSITVDGCEPGVGPTQWVCWVEQAYLAKAAELGLNIFVEGFEDDVTWAAAREPATTPTVASQTITWASNFAANDVSTGDGSQRSGIYAFYSMPHGDPTASLPSDRIYDGFTGTASSTNGLLGVGGWLVGQIGSRVDVIITHGGGSTTIPGFPDSNLTYTHRFFGFIDTAGFTSFEVVETDGTLNQPYFVFGDDFSFAVSGADTTPPRVMEIGSWEETADGVITEGEVVDVDISELMVRFSEPVQDLAGDTAPDDVTNPANYLFFDDGGDGFDTIDCSGGIAATDNAVSVTVWQYLTGEPSETMLEVNGGVALPAGSYRLLVCGTTSIVDWADNVLDGDGNGTGGDDFVRNFSVPVNNPPTATPQSVSTAEDTASGVTLTGSDPDGDPITFHVQTGPSHGVLSGSAPDLTYTPAANYHGPDSFTFRTFDDSLYSSSATVSITVNPINDRPTADDQAVSTLEDTAKAITLTGGDVDGDSLDFVIGTGPSHGVLTNAAPNVTYTPDANYSGPDSFTFTTSDTVLTSTIATVSITVNSVNDVPLAAADSATTDEDTAISIAVLTNDDLGDEPTTITAVTQGAKGSVVIDPGGTSVTYTPNLDTSGADTFTYTITDGDLETSVATVSMTVTPINDTPLAVDDGSTTDEDTAISIAVLTNDDLGDEPTTITAVTQGAKGSVAIDPGATSVTYTPTLDTNGADSFTYTITDADSETSIGAVTMTVDPVNDAPTADAGPAQTVFVTDIVTLDGSGSSDVDGDLLTYAWAFFSFPAGSTATLSDSTAALPTFLVDLPGDYVVELIVSDGVLFSVADTVTISTDNSPPVADAGPDQSAFVTDTIFLDGSGSSDVDGDLLTYAWSFFSFPAGSTATLSDTTAEMPTFVIDLPGTYVVELIVNDGVLFSVADTVTISTENTAPVADAGPDQSAFVTDTVTLDGSGSSDVDGDILTYLWSFSSFPAGSTATLSDTTAEMPTFVVDLPGTYVVQLIVNDSTVSSVPDTVSITTQNSAPVADPQSVSTAEDTGAGITLTGSDVDGDLISFDIATGPTHGSLTGTPPDMSYMPGPNYFGPDSFTYTASDATLTSPPATVTIDVLPVNDRPTADDQAVSTLEDTAKAITLTGGDVDGDSLDFSIGTGPSHGVLTNAPPNVTYTPDTNYSGPDSFTFTTSDTVLTSTIATVSITVTPVADPVLTIGDASVVEPDTGSTTVTITIHVADPSSAAIEVDFATADGSAVALLDYNSASGTLAIPALASSYDLDLEVIGDLVSEEDETFSVVLSNPNGATLGTPSTGTVTIFDNEAWTWFVATDGDDMNDCVTSATACRTISETVSRAAAGDLINVARGIYLEHLVLGIDLTFAGELPTGTIIDGGGTGVVIDISPATTIVMSGFEIRNGGVGGIVNQGDLTLEDSWIHGNGDGSPSSFGGISNLGTALVDRVALTENLGDTAGGVSNAGLLQIINSTISGNSSAGGPGINNQSGATLELHYSTITANGDLGIQVGGASTLRATIISDHVIANCDAAITSLGHNLEDADTCGLVLGGTDLIGMDPLLSALGDHGGSSPTHAISETSPALDAGEISGAPATDQCGVSRPIDGDHDGSAVSDIGAYEALPSLIFVDGFEIGDTSAWN